MIHSMRIALWRTEGVPGYLVSGTVRVQKAVQFADEIPVKTAADAIRVQMAVELGCAPEHIEFIGPTGIPSKDAPELERPM